MQTIWNKTIGAWVEVPDEAVDAYLRFPQYSRTAPKARQADAAPVEQLEAAIADEQPPAETAG